MISTRWKRAFGVALVIIAFAMGVQYTLQTAHERQLVECQARINRAFSQVVAARGALADADRAANRRLLETIAKATEPGQVRRAEHIYLETQRRLDEERAKHPYPRLPSEACH